MVKSVTAVTDVISVIWTGNSIGYCRSIITNTAVNDTRLCAIAICFQMITIVATNTLIV